MVETNKFGGKGNSLLLLQKLNIPTPNFKIIDPDVIQEHIKSNTLLDVISEFISEFDNFISVRSSPQISMPGMMNTILNVPLDEKIIEKHVIAVFNSYNSKNAQLYRKVHNLPDRPPAVILQEMVYGNARGISGSGVWFSRDNFGRVSNNVYDFKFNEFGEAVVSNSLNDFDMLPAEFIPELMDISSILERHYKDAVEIEFTIENGLLWILQCRKLEIVNPLSKCRVFEDLGVELTADQIDQLFSNFEFFGIKNNPTPDYVGVGVSPGIFTGILGDTILYESVINNKLIEKIFSASGIVTKTGGQTAHIAIQCRNLNIPYVIANLDNEVGKKITIDGTTGNVYTSPVELINITNQNYKDYLYV